MLPLDSWRNFLTFLLLCGVAAVSSSAQTFTTLHTFDITDGAFPYAALVQGLDGNFYGTTANGGRELCNVGCGTVFKITPDGTLTTLHEFVRTDGQNPQGGLVLASDGILYGTTSSGSQGLDTFFKITPGGTLTTLAQYGPGIGAVSTLIQANNGNLYGTTQGAINPGTVYGITPSGTATMQHNFCQIKNCPDGANPAAPLVQGTNGFLYGTTEFGGLDAGLCSEDGCGTIFEVGYAGSLSILHKFAGDSNGQFPQAGLMQASDGNFYGSAGGGSNQGGGLVFKITPQGTFSVLYNFCALADCADGAGSNGLVQATDGNFYGTSPSGGSDNCTPRCGTVFQLTPTGVLTVLHTFDKTDGGYPKAALVQGTDGNFYGVTTGFAGQHLYGTVFKLSTGLAPFVRTVPAGAYTHTQVLILGTNLTGATSVTFNGKTAVFTVVSPTEIQATVPGNATTGAVQVVTPGGTLLSNVPFQVL
jgi:uncharacterized repeat protein (TIGR03803 family)